MHPRVAEITNRIAERSAATRSHYLDHIHAAARRGPHRTALSCSNLAHGFAACDLHDKEALKGEARTVDARRPR